MRGAKHACTSSAAEIASPTQRAPLLQSIDIQRNPAAELSPQTRADITCVGQNTRKTSTSEASCCGDSSI
jgi:hypothetical protein